jgi:hypothetical protein
MQSLSCDKSDTTDKSSIVDAPAVIRDDDKHVEALAYANGAAACLQNRFRRCTWRAISELQRKPKLAAA